MATLLQSALSNELPEDLETLDDALDFVIPYVRNWSEDLAETEFWLDKRWLEVRDDPQFLESMLHIFREGEEYLLSIDGNVNKGKWKELPNGNTLIVESTVNGQVVKSELYDLAFLNEDFLVLKKHGDQLRKGQRKYWLLVNEAKYKQHTWLEAVEAIYNLYRHSSFYTVVVFVLVVVAVGILVFSFL